ncbi:hypothetical protein H4R35_000066 [Dimargaris xerosporica]|nr:hypothetical protein H4R35_000066 [Dimargaris xerosporica]
MVPHTLVALGQLPTTVNGKVDKHALAQLDLTAAAHFPVSVDWFDSWSFSSEPLSDSAENAVYSKQELSLRHAWAKLLDVPLDRIAHQAHFFQLGGDSIMAILLASKCRQQGYQLTVPTIYAHPVLASLAQQLVPLHDNSVAQCITPLSPLLSLSPTEQWFAAEPPLNPDERNQLKAQLTQRLIPWSQVEDLYPCTPLQARLLLSTLRNPHAYLLQYHITLTGELDVDRLEASWQQVAQRHTILRTVFLEAPSHRSIVHFDADLTKAAEELSAKACQRLHTNFALDSPLFQVSVGALPNTTNAHQMTITFHHAMLDGWSFSLLVAEILKCYHDLQSSALTSSFFKLVTQHILDNRLSTEMAQFWQEYLADAPQSPAPLLSPAADMRAAGYSDYRTQLPITKSMLLAFSRHHGLSLSTLFRGAYALALSRYLGTDQVVFGVTVAGRNLEVDNVTTLIGPCLSTVPFRVSTSDQPALKWLQQLHRDYVRMIPREQAIVADIARWCQIPSQTPLFSTIMGFDNQPPLDQDPTHSLQATSITFTEFTEYAFGVAFEEKPSAILCKVRYASAWCDDDVGPRVAQHLVHVVEQLITADQTRFLDSITLEPVRDDTDRADDTTTSGEHIVALFKVLNATALIAAKAPGQVALQMPDQSWTYSQLLTRVKELAHRMTINAHCPPPTVVSYEYFPHLPRIANDIPKLGGTLADLVQLRYLINGRFDIALTMAELWNNTCFPSMVQLIHEKLNTPDQLEHPQVAMKHVAVLYRTPLPISRLSTWCQAQLCATMDSHYYQKTVQWPSTLTQATVQTALDHVVAIRAQCRLSFVEEQGMVYQRVHAEASMTVRAVSLDDGNPANSQTIDDLAVQHHGKFDLHAPCLISVVILTTPRSSLEHCHALLSVRIHPLIGDQSFVSYLVRQLSVPCQPNDRNDYGHVIDTLPALTCTSEMVNQCDETQPACVEYWASIFKDAPWHLDLPDDRIMLADPTWHFNTMTADAASFTHAALTAFCKDSNTNLTDLLGALVSLYVARITNQSEFLLGLVESSDLDTLPSALSTCKLPYALPLRMKCTPQSSLTDLVELFRANRTGAQDHYSVQAIALALARTGAQQAAVEQGLCRVTLAVVDHCAAKSMMPAEYPIVLLSTSHAIQSDLQVQFSLRSNTMVIVTTYRRDRLSNTLASSLVHNLVHFIGEVLSVDCNPWAVPLTHPAEFEYITQGLAITPADSSLSWNAVYNVVDVVRANAVQYPDVVAIEMPSSSLTYHELMSQVDSVAAALHQRGVQPQQRVAMLASNHSDTAITLLALWTLGAVYMPIDSQLPTERQQYVIEIAKCTLVVNAVPLA